MIVDNDKSVDALKVDVGTMESRYRSSPSAACATSPATTRRCEPGDRQRMPYIVIVIDELADLMMVGAYEVEATLVAWRRWRGRRHPPDGGHPAPIGERRHRPDQGQLPRRIAFAMTSSVDSRTILDTVGAEDLLGRGDMLYQPVDAPAPMRLQGVLVTDHEVER